MTVRTKGISPKMIAPIVAASATLCLAATAPAHLGDRHTQSQITERWATNHCNNMSFSTCRSVTYCGELHPAVCGGDPRGSGPNGDHSRFFRYRLVSGAGTCVGRWYIGHNYDYLGRDGC